MPVPAEAQRRREVAVVEEVAQDVGLRRQSVVPLDEGSIGERLDDDVPLAVEGGGGSRQKHRGQADRRYADGRAPRCAGGAIQSEDQGVAGMK